MTQSIPAPASYSAVAQISPKPDSLREYNAAREKFNLAANIAMIERGGAFADPEFRHSSLFYATSPSLLGLQRKHHLRVFSHPAHQKINKLFSKFRDIQLLRKNWNGYDADPIPSIVIKRTRRFLDYSSRLWAYFEIFPTAADSIQLELLCSSGEKIEIEVEADFFTMCVFSDDGRSLSEKAFDKTNELAKGLRDALAGKELVS